MISREVLELYVESTDEPAAAQPLSDLLFWPSMACACGICWAILMAIADRQ